VNEEYLFGRRLDLRAFHGIVLRVSLIVCFPSACKFHMIVQGCTAAALTWICLWLLQLVPLTMASVGRVRTRGRRTDGCTRSFNAGFESTHAGRQT
jgi:hypothetical protein